MMTVVDQVSPWLTPRRALATSTQFQLGAHMSRNGTGAATSQPPTSTLFAAEAVGKTPGEIVRERLGHAEHDDERQHRGPRDQVEVLLGDRRQDASLHPDHRADEGIDEDEQRELREVLAQAEANCRRVHAAGSSAPRLARKIASISAGFGGTSASASTNSPRDLRRGSGFHRFSKAMVLDGLPLIPAPQTEPEKWPG